MNAKVIGIGAAGNKAAISLIEKGILPRKDILLVNSTIKDIPEFYRDISFQFEKDSGGCGKERDIAKELALTSLKEGILNLDGLLDPDDSTVIIVNSSEGGTGCGASIILAKYFKEVLEANVHMFVFTGFEDDGRGLQNTVEYFQEINEQYTVQAISNKKFLEEAGSKIKAEKLANEDFAMKIKILLGQIIVDSEQNIDETDLYKVSTTPGFMMIDWMKLDKIKNIEDFNKVMTNLIDHTKSLDISTPSAKRLGVIFNVSEKTQDYIDFSAQVLRKKLGFPYEFFYHIQNEGDVEFIAYIASGMDMPMDEIKSIYDRYLEASNRVNKNKDSFFDTISGFRGNQEDTMFNMNRNQLNKKGGTNADKKAFFGAFSMEPPTEPSKFSNTNLKVTKDKEIDPKNNY